MKPTKAMLDVIVLAREGWQIGLDVTSEGGYWQQNGGLGRGGASRRIHLSTGWGLLKRELITIGRRKFPTTPCALTDAGIELADAEIKRRAEQS